VIARRNHVASKNEARGETNRDKKHKPVRLTSTNGSAGTMLDSERSMSS
jgi:hypothetical protein